jgi:hypothetical protein
MIDAKIKKSTTLFLLDFFVSIGTRLKLEFVFLFEHVGNNLVLSLFSFDFWVNLCEFFRELFEGVLDRITSFGTDFIMTDSFVFAELMNAIGVDSMVFHVAFVTKNTHDDIGLAVLFDLSK